MPGAHLPCQCAGPCPVPRLLLPQAHQGGALREAPLPSLLQGRDLALRWQAGAGLGAAEAGGGVRRGAAGGRGGGLLQVWPAPIAQWPALTVIHDNHSRIAKIESNRDRSPSSSQGAHRSHTCTYACTRAHEACGCLGRQHAAHLHAKLALLERFHHRCHTRQVLLQLPPAAKRHRGLLG
jgi:hypothetical protein